METAGDNTSETRSQRDAELLWDHTGDFESDPLLGDESPSSGRHSGSTRPDTVQLSYEQAQDLLKVLDNTRYVLETFVEQAQHGDGAVTGGRRRRARGWWAFNCFPARRRTVAKYILIITAIIQAMNLVVVSVIDVWPKRDNQTVLIGTGITGICLQFVNVFFFVMVSVRLVRQVHKHKVSILLLAQSYVSTLLLFAGIYTFTYRMGPGSWKFIQEELDKDPILVVVLYSKFLYFSVSTATLCGSDNVLPKLWYTCLCTALQMLMSFVYFASILGQTLSQDTQYWLGVGHDDSDPKKSSSATTTSTDTTGQRQRGSMTSAAAVVNSVTSHVWRQYGGSRDPPDPEAVIEGKRENGNCQQAVLVDIEQDRHSLNRSPPVNRDSVLITFP
ncbi:uncharacterized protein [Littorina saxatilis]|uniref:uncharacterized protein n=1 Tax=Littorina saxatilis TaxID=31220 RepID=UPI0038B528C3